MYCILVFILCLFIYFFFIFFSIYKIIKFSIALYNLTLFIKATVLIVLIMLFYFYVVAIDNSNSLYTDGTMQLVHVEKFKIVDFASISSFPHTGNLAFFKNNYNCPQFETFRKILYLSQ